MFFQTKTLMGEVMKEAAFSLAEAKFASGDINQIVLQNVTKAQIKIRTKKDNVAGKKNHFLFPTNTFFYRILASKKYPIWGRIFIISN